MIAGRKLLQHLSRPPQHFAAEFVSYKDTMRRISPLLLVVELLLLFPVVCGAQQDAAKIIDQYVKAAGGGKALSKVRTVLIDGTAQAQAGNDSKSGTYSFRVKLPNRYYTELRNGAKTEIVAYNGKSVWHQGDSGQIETLLGAEALEVEAAAEYYNLRFLGLAKQKIGTAYKGTVALRGRQTYQIELTYPTGVQWEVFFDQQSHLIAAEKGKLAGIPLEIYYDDWRTTNGIKTPYKIEIHRGEEVYAVSVTRAVTDETIGERVFDFPMKSQVQLPDLKKLFEEIDANQKEIDKIKENYAGTQVEEETEYDKAGAVSKKEVNEYTFFYLNGDEVTTLVKKDGKPLSEADQTKENEKTRKRIEEAQKREKKKEEKEEKAKEEGKESKDNNDPGIEVFLRVSQFVNPRRERFRGQDVLVFDFEPNPEYKPKNIEEKVVKELAGVVWIDEKAKDVVRLEAYFVGDLHIGGGVLANLQKGTSFIFEQAYVNNEVWLPTYMEAHIGVRFLLVKGFKVNVTTKYSDYKRFNVETLNTINKPKESADAPSKP
jgi:outer membrane lipoprotein-sorting protein